MLDPVPKIWWSPPPKSPAGNLTPISLICIRRWTTGNQSNNTKSIGLIPAPCSTPLTCGSCLMIVELPSTASYCALLGQALHCWSTTLVAVWYTWNNTAATTSPCEIVSVNGAAVRFASLDYLLLRIPHITCYWDSNLLKWDQQGLVYFSFLCMCIADIGIEPVYLTVDWQCSLFPYPCMHGSKAWILYIPHMIRKLDGILNLK